MSLPFETGTVAAGAKFVGRRDYLAKCRKITKYDVKRGCLSVCGLPRIGKTSIVQKALKINSKKIIPVYVNLAAMESFFDLWEKITIEIFAKLDVLGVAFAFEQQKDFVIKACNNARFSELRESLFKLFKELAVEKYKCIIAIDEFDSIRLGKFGNEIQCGTYLNLLRDLFSQKTDVWLSLIVISRRDIASLEGKCAVGSTFHGVFGNNIVCVTGFDDADYGKYLEILNKHGVELSGKIKNDIEIYGGRSPYLLAQIGNYLCEDKKGETNIKEFARNQSMINYYDDLIRILEDEDYYETMIKVFIGPKYDLKPMDVNKLENLGYIYYHDKEKKVPFSLTKDFNHYLYEKMIGEERAEIWPNFTAAEIKLREIIRKFLTEKFHDSWGKELRNACTQNKIDLNVQKADYFMRNNEQMYPGEKNVLQVLAIWELSSIIDYYWNDGISLHFPRNTTRDYWAERFNLLQRARNPLAHSNPEFLTNEEVRLANIYCDEIRNNTTV